jgi:hypothetical protein
MRLSRIELAAFAAAAVLAGGALVYLLATA